MFGPRQADGERDVPGCTTNWRKDRTGADDTDILGDVGMDAFYKVTSNLTLILALNTDFAETEVDELQINLTRFPLFFPERRDFFLQDAGVFNFGSIGSRPIPFFRRIIGLSDGGEVPILTGSPRLSWNTFVQWDNVSETFGINSRLRWIPRPGREIFLVFNETLDEQGTGLTSLHQEVAFKLLYTIRL